MNTTAKIIVMEKPFELKPYGKKEMYHLLGISKHIFNRWMKSIQPQLGEAIGGLYNVKQVLLIIDTYGVPGQIVNQAA